MSHIYQEPTITFLVLDYNKETDTRTCLQSIRNRTKFPHKIIYLHNGRADYPSRFLEEGLVNQLIQTSKNNGLGIGTRDLFAACFSEIAIYWQNDQIMGRDFTEDEARNIIGFFGKKSIDGKQVCSVSLAGSPCGVGVYSERAHAIPTNIYKQFESIGRLGYCGAGPYHDGIWREAQIQELYRQQGYLHFPWSEPLAIDNGRTAKRENPDGSVWQHEPDRKGLYLLKGPVKERFIYPKLSDSEWNSVLSTQYWEPGKIPENELKDSFHVWN